MTDGPCVALRGALLLALLRPAMPATLHSGATPDKGLRPGMVAYGRVGRSRRGGGLPLVRIVFPFSGSRGSRNKIRQLFLVAASLPLTGVFLTSPARSYPGPRAERPPSPLIVVEIRREIYAAFEYIFKPGRWARAGWAGRGAQGQGDAEHALQRRPGLAGRREEAFHFKIANKTCSGW